MQSAKGRHVRDKLQETDQQGKTRQQNEPHNCWKLDAEAEYHIVFGCPFEDNPIKVNFARGQAPLITIFNGLDS